MDRHARVVPLCLKFITDGLEQSGSDQVIAFPNPRHTLHILRALKKPQLGPEITSMFAPLTPRLNIGVGPCTGPREI